MADYDGAVSATSRSDGASLNTALSKVHPELEQRHKKQEDDQHPKDLLRMLDIDVAEDEQGLEQDASVTAFHSFLERDSIEHPEHVPDHSTADINHVKALTKGVFVYDDEVLPHEGEE